MHKLTSAKPVLIENELWFVSDSALYKMQCGEWKTKLVADFAEFGFVGSKRVVFDRGNLYCISLKDNTIIVFNIENSEAKQYIMKCNIHNVYKEVFLYDGRLFWLPSKLDISPIIYNINTKKCKTLEWQKEIEKNKISGEIIIPCIRNGIIYATIKDSKKIISYSLINGELRVFNLDIPFIPHSIECVYDFFIITTKQKKLIYKWYPEKGIIQTYDNVQNKGEGYTRSIFIEDVLFLINQTDVDFFEMKKDNFGSLNVKSLNFNAVKGSRYIFGGAINTTYYLFPHVIDSGGMLKIDRNSFSCSVEEIVRSEEDTLAMHINKYGLASEKNDSLTAFFKYLLDDPHQSAEKSISNQGKKIFETIRSDK